MAARKAPAKKPAKKASATKRPAAARPRRGRAPAGKGAAAPARVIPEPARPLHTVGRAMWDQVWQRGDVRGNVESFLLLCEQLDERSALRARVFERGDYRDRAGLRALEDSIVRNLAALGLAAVMPDQAEAPDDWTTRAGT